MSNETLILSTLEELQPCGLRAVVGVLELDHSEVKSSVEKLIAKGKVRKQPNGQYVTVNEPKLKQLSHSELEKIRPAPVAPVAAPSEVRGGGYASVTDDMSIDELMGRAIALNSELDVIRRIIRERTQWLIGGEK